MDLSKSPPPPGKSVGFEKWEIGLRTLSYKRQMEKYTLQRISHLSVADAYVDCLFRTKSFMLVQERRFNMSLSLITASHSFFPGKPVPKMYRLNLFLTTSFSAGL